MFDDRLSQPVELGMPTEEILLTIVRPAAGRGNAKRTFFIGLKLPGLAGPAAFRTLDPVTNPGDQIGKWNFQRNCGVDFPTPLRKPAFQKNRLR